MQSPTLLKYITKGTQVATKHFKYKCFLRRSKGVRAIFDLVHLLLFVPGVGAFYTLYPFAGSRACVRLSDFFLVRRLPRRCVSGAIAFSLTANFVSPSRGTTSTFCPMLKRIGLSVLAPVQRLSLALFYLVAATPVTNPATHQSCHRFANRQLCVAQQVALLRTK